MNKLSKIMNFSCKVIIAFLIAIIVSNNVNAQISVTGGSGLNATYSSFTKSDGLFAALNALPQTGNNVVVTITGNITDENGAVGLGNGTWNSIRITPSGSITVSGSTSTATLTSAGLPTTFSSLFNFNGADNVKIDGLNSGGNSLTISCSSTILVNTIGFINDAKNDTLTNLTILGSGTSATSNHCGTIAILTADAGGTGNDNIVITNNNIGAASGGTPTNAIYSYGTNATADNGNVTITGNNIFDYWNPVLTSRAINIDATVPNSANNWNISTNKFYQTGLRTCTLLGNTSTVATVSYILFLGTGDGHTINSNTFGYSSNNGTGNYAMTVSTPSSTTSFVNFRFTCILIGGCATSPANIQGNTFANFRDTTSSNGFGLGSTSSFICIQLNNNASANIGTTTGNTFGSTTGTNNIVNASNYPATGGGGAITVISCSTIGALNIRNNTFGAINSTIVTPGVLNSSSNGTLAGLGVIYFSNSPSSLTVDNNIIGNSTADNLFAGVNGSFGPSPIVGVYAIGSNNFSFNVTNNTIRNFRSFGANSSSFARAISNSGSSSIPATVNISNNTITNINCNAQATSMSSGLVAASGITCTVGTNGIISNNSISNINDTSIAAPTTGIHVAGIVIAGMQNARVFKNKIFDLTNASLGVTQNTPSTVSGIVMDGAVTSDSIYNNFISLGTNDTTRSSKIGIWHRGGTGATLTEPANGNFVYHNTVNIAGTTGRTAADSLPSFGFLRGNFSTTARVGIVQIRNNIFTNNRVIGSGGSTLARNYAIANNFRVAAPGTTGWNSNNNVLNSSSTSTVGLHNNAPQTFAAWQTAMSSDALSYSAITVTYVNAQNDLHLNMGSSSTNIESRGDATIGIRSDIDDETRPGPNSPANGGSKAPDLGADEIDGGFNSSGYCSGTPTGGTAGASSTTLASYNTAITLTLTGSSTGVGITYQWQSSPNGTTWTNIINANATTVSVTPTLSSTQYRCVVTCTNGNTSTNSSTVTVNAPTPMPAGVYTINSSSATTYPSGSNFQTFTAAVSVLNTNGIAGAVTFNVSNGPYNEMLVLNQVNGANAINTITINGGGSLLWGGTNTTTVGRGVLTLNGTDYLTVNNLRIDASGNNKNFEASAANINTAVSNGNGFGTGNFTVGYGIVFTNDANFNTINNCIVAASTTSITANNTAAISFAVNYTTGSQATTTTGAFLTANNNTINGCTLIGGHISIYLNASTTAYSFYSSGNSFTGNTLKEWYSVCIQAVAQRNLNIERNDISRPTRSTSTSITAIGLNSGMGDSVYVQKNRIHDLFGGHANTHTNSISNCINASNGGGSPNRETFIINNLIYNLYGSGSMQGINLAGFTKAYHNTIVIDSGSSTAGAVTTFGLGMNFLTGPADVKNNLISIGRRCLGNKVCYNFTSATLSSFATLTSNYNNFYLSDLGKTLGNNYPAWLSSSTPYTTLAAFQTATNFDLNSQTFDPAFDAAQLPNYIPTSALLDNLGTTVGVLDDIVATTRPTTVTVYAAPDMGAFEFSSQICDLGIPNPGTATSSLAVACAGTLINLNLISFSSGSQQSYTWQASTNNSTWSDISLPSNLPSLTTSQTVSRYYRCKIQCTEFGTPKYSSAVFVNTPTPSTGTFNIDKNSSNPADFTSFGSAINSMACGIAGPIIFNVVPNSGPYNEQISLGFIIGTNATNTIRFNGNRNTIAWLAQNTTERHTIRMNGVNFCTFDNLIIEAKSTTPNQTVDAGIGVFITNASSSNTISNCKIDVGAGSNTTNNTTVNHAGILMAATQATGSGTFPTGGNTCNYNTITNDTIIGGVYSVGLGGGANANACIGNVVSNNVFRDFHYYGVITQNQTGVIIRNNDFSRPTRLSSSFAYPIYLYNNTNTAVVDRNKIHDIYTREPGNTSTFYGISTPVTTNAGIGTENLVTNNLIYSVNRNATSSTYGLNITSSFTHFYHNTIIFDNQNSNSTTNTYCLYLTNTAYNNRVRNNIFYQTHKGTGSQRLIQISSVYLDTSAAVGMLDNNLYYSNLDTASTNYRFATNTFSRQDGGGNTIIAPISAKTIQEWRAAHTVANSTIDANSKFQFVGFKNPAIGDYTPSTLAVDNLGTNQGVTTDILGTTRSNTTPDVGAFEFDVVACSGSPVGGVATSSSTTTCIGDNFTLDVSGQSTGLGITYQWQRSPNNLSWTDVGGLLDSSTSFTTTQSTDNYYRVKITCTNSNQVAYSTTILVFSPQYVNGTFNIDSSQATNIAANTFQSFADAVSYISCGINGPVVFNVQNNGYVFKERVVLPAITGTSSVNTITFNGNGVTFSPTAIVAAERTAFGLNGTDWVTINNFNIDVTGSSTNGVCIALNNNANNNTINNCTLNSGANLNQTAMHGVVISPASVLGTVGTGPSGSYGGSNNTITGCTFIGGYYAACFYANGSVSGVTTRDSNNVISSCTFQDFSNSAVYFIAQNGSIVRDCDMFRTAARTTYSATTQVILLAGTNVTQNCLIERNKIHDLHASNPTATSTINCLQVNASQSTAGTENKFYNNIVYNVNNSAGLGYGIFISSGSFVKFYHNTIVFDGNFSGQTYGILVTSSNSNGIDIRNNLISNTRLGTGLKRMVQFGTNNSVISGGTFIMNNNNYFMNTPNGADNFFGTSGSPATIRNTITDWQNATGADLNSVQVNPVFANAAIGNFAPTTSSLNSVGASGLGVTTDIVGNARTQYFIPGAYEIDNQPPTISSGSTSTLCASSFGSVNVPISGVTITDASGITTTGSLRPRLYYKKTGGVYSSINGTMTAGNAFSSTWDFTISSAALGTLNSGDVISYFIVAQDVYTTPNIGSSASSGFFALNVNTITGFPTNASEINVQANTPSVSINTASATVCSNSNVAFNALGVNAGSSPIYQWYKNSSPLTTGNSITFAPNTLSTGDNISCILTSNIACRTTDNANSNIVTMFVNASPAKARVYNGATGGQIPNDSIVYCTLGTQLPYYAEPTLRYGRWVVSDSSILRVNGVGSSSGLSSSGSISTLANGIATLSYVLPSTSNTNPCTSSTDIKVIIANQVSPNPVTGGASSVCVGDTATFYCATPNGVWGVSNGTIVTNSGFVTFRSASSSVVSYKVTNAYGCSATSTKTVVVNALPAVPNIAFLQPTSNPFLGAPSGRMCRNRTFNIAGYPGLGTWSFASPLTVTPFGTANATLSSAQVYSGTRANNSVGSITYTITNTATTCSNRRTIVFATVDCGTKGVTNEKSLSSSNKFVMFPNPTKSIVNISVDKLVGEGQIIITDLLGKQLKVQPLSMGNNQVNVTGFAKGIYFVNVVTSAGKSIEKLIVE